jgi:NDP-sugar pyrophosphorylase family protein
MNAGIIAAGWGTRLGGGPKALRPLAGRALIDHVIDGLVSAGADRITCIVNEASRDVPAYVAGTGRSLPIDWIVQTTPTSMHSFLLVLERLAQSGEAWNLITTVDAICAPETVATFVRDAAAIPSADLVLGLTDLIEDEKPLYATVQGQAAMEPVRLSVGEQPDAFRVRALGLAATGSAYVTAGLYRVAPALLKEKEVALARGFGALREFLGHVLASGYSTYGVPVASVVDVDVPADLVAAERLVRRPTARDES